MNNKNIKNNTAVQRQTRIRRKVANVTERPRLSVFRSNKYCYVQVIDASGNTLFGLSEKAVSVKEKKADKPVDRVRELGRAIAKMALEKKIKTVVFDKGKFAYHGRVKAVAEGAREGGLEF